jgi:hypothetical protein
MPVAAVAPATAAGPPGVPIVERITAVAGTTKGGVNVTVLFGRPETSPWAPVTEVQVNVGGVLCTVKPPAWKPVAGAAGPMATGTAVGVPAGRTVKVTVRGKNLYGYGQWSKAVRFKTQAGSTWKRPSG